MSTFVSVIVPIYNIEDCLDKCITSILNQTYTNFELILSDDGKPFDPLAQRDPDTTLSAAEREIGGLGILIVKKTMSPVTYRRRNGNNILTMGKDYGN